MSATTSPWDTGAPVASVANAVTLVEGHTFCISDPAGDIEPTLPHGLFLLDARVLSRFELRIDGQRLESVGVSTPDPFSATFAGRLAPQPDGPDPAVVAFRRRHIGRGLRERLRIVNFGMTQRQVQVELICDADFADLFDVKEQRLHRSSGLPVASDATCRAFENQDRSRRVDIRSSAPAPSDTAAFRWTVHLAPAEAWETCLEVTLAVEGQGIRPRFECGADHDQPTGPKSRLDEWLAGLPELRAEHPHLLACLTTSAQDIGALRMFDPESPDVPMVAAGAPWFMTVFGRDSLITGWMSLIADAGLARGVLQILARFQGTEERADNEEEPGRILHEMRFGSAAGLSLSEADCYYGSIDSTPLFVALLGEVHRWGGGDEFVSSLLPHADAALEWMTTFADRDGDGYLEYERKTPNGLLNQAWKDSWDAVRFADGTLAEPPIAMCEVQGYAYAAYVARAEIARALGDDARQQRWSQAAAELKARFNEDFWLEESGTVALALDGRKRRVDAIASNAGHCLWSGILEPERAAQVAERLLREDLFSGWGVRTLSTEMTAFNPLSYHNGSVWPHDNALIAAGLMRYGFADEAHRIIEAQLAAAALHDDRLPELFAGFSRTELDAPGAYPSSCSPQAWASASPGLWMRSLLRLEPAVPQGSISVRPALPRSIPRLSVRGIALGDQRLDVDVAGSEVRMRLTPGPARLVGP